MKASLLHELSGGLREAEAPGMEHYARISRHGNGRTRSTSEAAGSQFEQVATPAAPLPFAGKGKGRG